MTSYISSSTYKGRQQSTPFADPTLLIDWDDMDLAAEDSCEDPIKSFPGYDATMTDGGWDELCGGVGGDNVSQTATNTDGEEDDDFMRDTIHGDDDDDVNPALSSPLSSSELLGLETHHEDGDSTISSNRSPAAPYDEFTMAIDSYYGDGWDHYFTMERGDEDTNGLSDTQDENQTFSNSSNKAPNTEYDAVHSLPFELRFEATMRNFAESMKRSQATRRSLKMQTPQLEKYPRRHSITSVVKSVEHSALQLQTLLEAASATSATPLVKTSTDTTSRNPPTTKDSATRTKKAATSKPKNKRPRAKKL